jgi:hypothetical protein
MSVPTTISPEKGSRPQRSRLRRWLTAAVASAIIAAAGIALVNGDGGAGRSDGDPPSTETATPSNQFDWPLNDPRVVKGARGAPVR